jgi:hypothetical protein
MKTKCLSRTQCLVAVSLMILGVLLTCYSTIANTGRGRRQVPTSTAGIYPAEDDQDPEYREKRDEFLRGFFGTGPGGVSPSAYTSAPARAHCLQARFCKAGGSSRPKRWRWLRHGLLQSHPPFATVTAETPVQESILWLSIRSTPTSFIQEASAGLPKRPTAASRGGICPTRGLHKALVLSLSVLAPPTSST